MEGNGRRFFWKTGWCLMGKGEVKFLEEFRVFGDSNYDFNVTTLIPFTICMQNGRCCITWYFSLMLNSLYRATWHTFQPKFKKLKKNRIKKISYIFSKKVFLVFLEMELSSPKLKKLIFFSKKKFPIFQKGTCKAQKIKKCTSKKFLMFL